MTDIALSILMVMAVALGIVIGMGIKKNQK